MLQGTPQRKGREDDASFNPLNQLLDNQKGFLVASQKYIEASMLP